MTLLHRQNRAEARVAGSQATNEGGYIVVETLFSFTMLIMVMFIIISLINIVAIQSRIHFAISQTAQEMSMYAYVTKCLSKDEEEYDPGLSGGLDWVASSKGALDTLSGGITNFSNNIAAGMTGFFFDSYAADLMRVVAAAPDAAKRQLVMEDAVKDVFVNYLSLDSTQSAAQANEYLSASGVYSIDGAILGLDAISFSNSDGVSSTMLDSNGDTVVTVAYKIRFNIYNIIPLPLYLDMEQTVRTKAWLGGRTQK